ncbi:putative hydrolase YxeP [Rubripirellula lacrimiformis]|uniref:Putative hydrolase YxeP n=1 Tax=Rubripirellula lacrimiformis TaxID=1930273 RepID=A0A517NC36_9BACT|nr:amidohydrolase [Rubripirellula lacrimiformis]QDT04702.1 putative hydrolase YxeP [Rubripirellula lacrimiformis]
MTISTAIEVSKSVGHIARSVASDIQKVRRHLHQRPELSEGEYATTEYLSNLIHEQGLDPKLAGDRRGVWADLRSCDHAGGPCVAIRGDIDALPIQTELSAEYASRRPGIMHACGHDAHTAMVWGAMAILNQLSKSNAFIGKRTVRFLFQPAEEISTGGLHMIEAGALSGVDAAIALHVDPTRPVGSFGHRAGAFTAGCDTFTLVIKGQSGHGARPHLTGDTVGAAASWINDVYCRLPRNHDAREAVVVNVGQITAGSASNVVPGEARLSGTLRTLSVDAATRSAKLMRQITRATELKFPVKADLTFVTHTPPVINDFRVNAVFRHAAELRVGPAKVVAIDQPSMGAEDFSFCTSIVPGAMMRIGVAGDRIGSEPLHTPNFDIDESALEHGAAVMALAALDLTSGAIA